MTFTKQVFPYYQSTDFGHFYNCTLYTLFNNDKIVGQFIQSHKAFLSTVDNSYRIDTIDHFIKPKEYIIHDIKTRENIGFYSFQPLGMAPKKLGNVTLNNNKYHCTLEDSAIQHKLFDRATWGHYQMSLKNLEIEISYTIHVASNLFDIKRIAQRKATGTIISTHTDNSLILAGLLFFEQLFDSMYSG